MSLGAIAIAGSRGLWPSDAAIARHHGESGVDEAVVRTVTHLHSQVVIVGRGHIVCDSICLILRFGLLSEEPSYMYILWC